MSKKNVITISAKQDNIILLYEGSEDYLGIPCLKLDVEFPEVRNSEKQEDKKIEWVKICKTKKSYFLMMQRNSKFKIVDSINPTTEFATTNPVSFEALSMISSFNGDSKFELLKGLVALAIVNFASTLNTSHYSDCGLDFDFKSGFTFINRGDVLDQFTDMILIYEDILLNDGMNINDQDLNWYYAQKGRNVVTGQYAPVSILPAIAKRIAPEF